MRKVDKMLEQQKQKNIRDASREPEYPDEVEIHMKKEITEPINIAGNVFDRDVAKRFGGINTAPSVFDKGVVFRTKSDENN